MKDQAVTGVTGIAMAAHLFCTRETLADYVARDVISRLPNGNYDLDECRRRAFGYLRDRSAGRQGKTNGPDLSTERAMLAREQRETAAIRNQVARGDLVPMTLVTRQLETVFGVVRERILTAPGKCADPCEMRSRDEIELIIRGELTEALNELHDPAAFGRTGDPGGNTEGAEGSAPAADAERDRVG